MGGYDAETAAAIAERAGVSRYTVLTAGTLNGTGTFDNTSTALIVDFSDIQLMAGTAVGYLFGDKADSLMHGLTGGLVDGPVYRSIFENLLGIHLAQPDEYERWNGGFVVYHADYGDYSTNEPIMDGTGMLTYLLAAMAP